MFCRIISGDEPASFVYGDDECVAFLSLHQVRPGEIAIIPREHIDHFTDVPDATAAHMMKVAQRFGRALQRNLDPDRVGYLVHGYGVAHAHLMVVPQHAPNDITSGRLARVEDGRVVFSIEQLPLVPREELDRLASEIRAWAQDV
ncbi:MAG: HIT family protein [Actinomycetota bacterium]